MYGHIHVLLREYVQQTFGNKIWEQVLQTCKYDDEKYFSRFESYQDEVCEEITKAILEVCKIDPEKMQEGAGNYFFKYLTQTGYDKMLKTLGDNFISFVQNLDSLHETLSITYTEMKYPSFRCEVLNDNKLELHYYSAREGLYPVVIGLLKSVAKDLFQTEISLAVKERHKLGENVNNKKEHVVFDVNLQDTGRSWSKRGKLVNNTILPYDGDNGYQQHLSPPNKIGDLLSMTDFRDLMPFHIMFDKTLQLLSLGTKIYELTDFGYNCRSQCKLCGIVNLVYPDIPFDYNHILQFINSKYVLQLNSSYRREPMSIKGQMVYLRNSGNMIFMGSPLLKSLDDLEHKHVYLSDIPMYDATREVILMSQQRITELEISKKLDQTTTELKKVASALSEEKKKTDQLLYQMLPVKVANRLREGKQVEAEKFSESTVLFGDIVSFTVIASLVQPIQIVDMLNELYNIFDELTNTHSVYKVETIGDAYMVVGGVPDRSPRHAQEVATFALDMVENAVNVTSPASGRPIQMRIGIHSGSVVAGVVGHKMPRYCLFGDTVNTASRMESHGQPDKVHCSEATYSILSSCEESANFTFQPRGRITIKGKGLMTTYFLAKKTSQIDKISFEIKESPTHSTKETQTDYHLTCCPPVDYTNYTKICQIL